MVSSLKYKIEKICKLNKVNQAENNDNTLQIIKNYVLSFLCFGSKCQKILNSVKNNLIQVHGP